MSSVLREREVVEIEIVEAVATIVREDNFKKTLFGGFKYLAFLILIKFKI